MVGFVGGSGAALGLAHGGRSSTVCARRRVWTVLKAKEGAGEDLERPVPPKTEILSEGEDEVLLGLEEFLTEEERTVQRPNDPTNMRTESERRRISQRSKKLRRKRRKGEVEPDWDKMETRPLVKKPSDPRTGEDYWIDLKSIQSKPRRRKPKIDKKLRERLKQETASPYKQNWIGIVFVVVFVLVVLYNILPNTSPVIPLPDL
uniref:Uncharacterized protein n=1 Tax=Rhodosorus marinus TaxID=101924 RepID=A0A6T6MVX8_9RHOD|mmetsp:Transcript_3914/g.5528  ORF Transcript_3914/g.5528 Transcript_3914/m.5528 type:complete len:204 (+) Transcript_3914:45-656(+)